MLTWGDHNQCCIHVVAENKFNLCKISWIILFKYGRNIWWYVLSLPSTTIITMPIWYVYQYNCTYRGSWQHLKCTPSTLYMYDFIEILQWNFATTGIFEKSALLNWLEQVDLNSALYFNTNVCNCICSLSKVHNQLYHEKVCTLVWRFVHLNSNISCNYNQIYIKCEHKICQLINTLDWVTLGQPSSNSSSSLK